MAGNRSLTGLGDVLLREGLITDSQLSTALQVQRDTEKSLGCVLVEMGLITERVRMRLLQQRLGYDIVHISRQKIDPTLFDLVPKSLAVKRRLVPIRLDLDTLAVAMEDPTDVTALDTLKDVTGLRIKPAIATIEEIEAVLKQYPESPEEAKIEIEIPPSKLAIIISDFILFCLLAAPFAAFFLIVPTKPEWLSYLTTRAVSVDVFIFTLIGYGIYAVVAFEVWALLVRRRRPKAPSPPPESEE